MRWLDIAGPPGVGKSALCDHAWPPRGIHPDGRVPPLAWASFLAVVHDLLASIAHHPSASACRSMMGRSLAKMATVSRIEDPRIYVQTGLAQRGLGIGWRLDNPEAIAPYFEQMPVSRGVVFLTAPVDVVQARNVARGKDRSHMVPLIQRPLEIAMQVLRHRGVTVSTIDTTQPIADSRRQLAELIT